MSQFPGDLSRLETFLASELAAAADRKFHPFHWPVMATTAGSGAPRMRTMVLRSFDSEDRAAIFWTTLRSAKAAHIEDNPKGSLLFFDRERMLQLRLNGTASVEVSGNAYRSALDRVRSDEALLQQFALVPDTGSEIPDAEAYECEEDVLDASFCVIRFEYSYAEFLALSGEMPKRAGLRFKTDTADATWLVP
jgi:hypothetical protein